MGADLILSERDHKRYLNWLERDRLVCARCKKEILPSDEIHRCGKVYARNNQWDLEPSGNPRCRLYHAECFEQMFIDL